MYVGVCAKAELGSIALVGGNVYTMDDANTVASAVLAERGRITIVGTDDEVTAAASEATEVIPLDGRAVVPGLIDAHAHVEAATIAHQCWLDVREMPLDGSLAAIREAVAASDPGEWVSAQGTFGQDLPSRRQLDELAPHNPVIFRMNAHRVVVNSMALRLAGISERTPAPRGAWFSRDADGLLNGVVQEGSSLFPVPWPSGDDLARRLRAELLDSFVCHGVTTVYELPASADGMRAYTDLAERGELPVRLSTTLTVAPGFSPMLPTAAALTHTGLRTGFGNSRLWLGGLKLFLDGDGPACFSTTHKDLGPSEWGLLTRDRNELVAILADAYRNRLQVWMHAGGDLIQEIALDAIDEALLIAPWPDHRTRIEHLGNPAFNRELISRMVANGSIPVPNAVFMYGDEAGVYAFRSFIRAGLRPPGTSDTAGAQIWSTNPWASMHLNVNRRSKNGIPVTPDEAISVDEALRTYTRYGAYAGFKERELGSIEVGKAADFAVLADNPYQVPIERLRDVRADLTIVAGCIVWSAS